MKEEEESEGRSLVIFGKDVSKIPCYRRSMLWGISGGLGTGLMYFMFTSKARMAAHVAMGSFMGISTCFWIGCRYMYFDAKFKYSQMQSLMNTEKPDLDNGPLPSELQKDLKSA